jgi:hypothetical protein
MTHLSVRQAGAVNHIATVSAGKKTLSVATQSFANQMSRAFAETLSKVRSAPNSGKQTIADSASQINVARQNSSTASNPGVKAPVGFNALIPTTNTTPPPNSAADVATYRAAVRGRLILGQTTSRGSAATQYRRLRSTLPDGWTARRGRLLNRHAGDGVGLGRQPDHSASAGIWVYLGSVGDAGAGNRRTGPQWWSNDSLQSVKSASGVNSRVGGAGA